MGMKILFEKWWCNNTKVFQITNYKELWKENGTKPMLKLFHNGGKKKNGDIVFDISLIVGYTIFNYTDWDLQRLGGD